ncbi:MAG: patatin family protein [Lachnospiraceae bacterium]|nr:patatin family protein [Lachnospiraceae bacterium]
MENKTEFKDCALVLEGGGSRGVFTGGYLDYLMEKDVYLPYCIGVSAGACNALDYASGQIGRTRDCFIIRDKHLRPLKVSNMLTKKYLYDMDLMFVDYPNRYVPFDFKGYQKRGMRVEMGVADLANAKAGYLSEYEDPSELLRICRASCSLPFMAPPVRINGHRYMDGGLADSMPYGRALMLGYKKIVVILTQKKGYKKSLKSKMNPIIKKVYRDEPMLLRMMFRRPYVYNRQLDILDRLEREDRPGRRFFVVNPEESVVSRTESDVHKLDAFYQHGYNLAKEQFNGLMEFLKA